MLLNQFHYLKLFSVWNVTSRKFKFKYVAHIIFHFDALDHCENQDNASKFQKHPTIITVLIMWGYVCILIVKCNNLLAFLIFWIKKIK